MGGVRLETNRFLTTHLIASEIVARETRGDDREIHHQVIEPEKPRHPEERVECARTPPSCREEDLEPEVGQDRFDDDGDEDSRDNEQENTGDSIVALDAEAAREPKEEGRERSP